MRHFVFAIINNSISSYMRTNTNHTRSTIFLAINFKVSFHKNAAPYALFYGQPISLKWLKFTIDRHISIPSYLLSNCPYLNGQLNIYTQNSCRYRTKLPIKITETSRPSCYIYIAFRLHLKIAVVLIHFFFQFNFCLRSSFVWYKFIRLCSDIFLNSKKFRLILWI